MIQSRIAPFKRISFCVPTLGREHEEIIQLVQAIEDVIWRWIERRYEVDEIEDCEEGEGE